MPMSGSVARLAVLATVGAMLVSVTGCTFVLPRTYTRTEALWESFDDAQQAFEHIVSGETTTEELVQLGYDPRISKNVMDLDYLSLVAALIPGSVLRPEDIPEGLRRCIAVQDDCRGYRAQAEIRKTRREGFWLLDLLRFRRQVETKGWSFTGTAVLADGVVVYKAWSGTPAIQQYSDEIQPLGPLQDPSSLLLRLIPF